MAVRRRWLLVPAVVLAAGCSAAPPTAGSTAPSPSAADPAPAWVDKICAAGVTIAAPAVARPSLTSTDLAVLQKDLSTYLGTVATGIATGRTQLDAAGPSPVEGAQGPLDHARTVLDALGRTVTDARTKVDQADPRNPAAFAATLGDVRTALTSTGASDALRDVLAVPGVAAVAGSSPACTQLRSLAARVGT